ncbi:MAG TPA: sensor histidine kinase [Mycobacteriales bacterium]|nr:sensor histidine kinase [Mycobacteriales bacterium]
MPRWPRSLRGRLTLLAAVTTAAVVAVVATVLYVTLTAQLSNVVDDALRQRARDLVADLRARGVEALAEDPGAQLFAADGSLVASSPRLAFAGRLLSRADVRRAARRPVTREVERSREDAEVVVRVYAVPAGTRVLAVAADFTTVDRSRERVLLALLAAAPILVGAGAVTVRWAAGRALRPVAALTAEAAAISATDADRRLPVPAGDDEVARLARTLARMLARLHVAVERERAFVDDAAHELRTPLAVLRAELELALSAPEDRAEVERSLTGIRAEVERLSRLAEDLLLLARSRAGTLGLRPEAVDVGAAVRALAARLHRAVPLTVSVSGPAAMARVDPARLDQMLTNVLTNSARAGARHACVSVSRPASVGPASVGPASVDTVRVAIRDDGSGFPSEFVDEALERFTRADTARGPGGAGLGLAITAALARAAGGSVTVGNAPTGGAEVVLTLPAA